MAKCAKCLKIITKKCPGLQCSKCSKWLHGACAALTPDQLSALSVTDSVDWRCKSCTGGAKHKRLSCIVPDPEEEEGTDAETDTMITSAIIQNITRDLRREVKEIIREELQTTLLFYSDKIDDYEKKMQTFETTTKRLENTCEDIKNKYKNMELKYQAMEQKLSAIEQSQLANNLEICGVDVCENDDVLQITSDIATRIECSPRDILEVYRKTTRPRQAQGPAAAGHQRQPLHPPTIMVQLRTGCRSRWLEAAKNKKTTTAEGPRTGALGPKIYFREPLTPYISYLLWKAKTELKSTELCKYVWVKDGQVLARKSEKEKIIPIRSETDIDKIKSQLRSGPSSNA